MTWLKRLIPFLMLLAILAPHTALAATRPMAQANAPATAAAAAAATPGSGLTIDVNGSGLFTDRMLQIVALITVDLVFTAVFYYLGF